MSWSKIWNKIASKCLLCTFQKGELPERFGTFFLCMMLLEATGFELKPIGQIFDPSEGEHQPCAELWGCELWEFSSRAGHRLHGVKTIIIINHCCSLKIWRNLLLPVWNICGKEEMVLFALSQWMTDVSIHNWAGLVLPSEEQLSALPLAQLCMYFILTSLIWSRTVACVQKVDVKQSLFVIIT